MDESSNQLSATDPSQCPSCDRIRATQLLEQCQLGRKLEQDGKPAAGASNRQQYDSVTYLGYTFALGDAVFVDPSVSGFKVRVLRLFGGFVVIR